MSLHTVRWRRPGEDPHFLLRRRSFGGNAAGTVELELASLTAEERARWSEPGVGRPCPAVAASDTAVRFSVPDDAAGARLTFTVRIRVGGEEAEVLTVTQRFTLDGGRLHPDAYEVPRYALVIRERGGGGQVSQRVPGWVPGGRVRRFLGRHPLLTVGADRAVEVGTEFLDVTGLWWALHFKPCPNNTEDGFNPWYLEPSCNDRPERLRVLLGTRVAPMLWFASVPVAAGGDAARGSQDLPDGTGIGGYVFYRPVASAYAYSATDLKVLTEPKHATKGMRNLCRYLLRGHTRAGAARIGGVPDWPQLLDHSMNETNPLGGYGYAPCGMDHALDRASANLLAAAKQLRILLMPVASSGGYGGYGGITGPGYGERTANALRLLWTRGAFGGPGQQLLAPGEPAFPVPPQPGPGASGTGTRTGTLRLAEDVWAGAYSSGGDALWTVLGDPGNRRTTGRVLVFDTNGFTTAGRGLLLALAKERGRGLQVHLVWSPYDMGRPPGAFVDELRARGARVQVLPKAGTAYYRPPPNPDNPWAEYVFGAARPWKSSMFPGRKLAEWWHQFAVFGGEVLHEDPRDPRSVGFMEATMEP
ncbi:hypothetical protein [Streptomyces sp. DSM 40907]|uniref:hypothetical protein n=1 Tax=Streptomyces kutzneri TaxID=3051179 RepID=UPI0028D0F779|nr:hypothetical protein [Streptomyces sp. DSM 40907]